MPIPSLPLELEREIIFFAAEPEVDPLQTERRLIEPQTGCQRYSPVMIPIHLSLVSQTWNVCRHGSARRRRGHATDTSSAAELRQAHPLLGVLSPVTGDQEAARPDLNQ